MEDEMERDMWRDPLRFSEREEPEGRRLSMLENKRELAKLRNKFDKPKDFPNALSA